MAPYFENKLFELMPPLYRIEDETGDLAAFLKVPAVSLDELKELIERFPDIFDVDRCEPRYLPYLAHLVGRPYDGTIATETQRNIIKEAVPLYRRKATIPAIRRSLVDLGWEGMIEETYRGALRLNSRPILNRAKLPGLVHSLGAYRVRSETQTPGIRDALRFHHPAGTRAWFWRWLLAFYDTTDELTGLEKLFVRRILFGDPDETFRLNYSGLGAGFHLTYKRKTWSFLVHSSAAALSTDFDAAATCFISWHGRGDRMRLNTKALNTRMLANTWESERKFGICCEIQARRQPAIPRPTLRLNEAPIGGALLNHAKAPCRIRFRQNDYYGETPLLAPACAGERWDMTRYSIVRPGHFLRPNRSRLGGPDRLNGAFATSSLFTQYLVTDIWAEVEEAWDVVERWRANAPAFTLNASQLNTGAFSDATQTAAVAAFELRVDTGIPRRRRVQPLSLNRHQLNRTALRLSVERHHPLRLGRMALNQAGLHRARRDIVWRTGL